MQFCRVLIEYKNVKFVDILCFQNANLHPNSNHEIDTTYYDDPVYNNSSSHTHHHSNSHIENQDSITSDSLKVLQPVINMRLMSFLLESPHDLERYETRLITKCFKSNWWNRLFLLSSCFQTYYHKTSHFNFLI